MNPAWMSEARCRGADPELFFPAKGTPNRDAKRICKTCPVLFECRDYALEHDERYGLWGGLGEQERRTIRRRARVRAAAAARLIA